MRAERCDLSVSAEKKPVNFVWHSLKMNIFVSEVIVTELLSWNWYLYVTSDTKDMNY